MVTQLVQGVYKNGDILIVSESYMPLKSKNKSGSYSSLTVIGVDIKVKL